MQKGMPNFNKDLGVGAIESTTTDAIPPNSDSQKKYRYYGLEDQKGASDNFLEGNEEHSSKEYPCSCDVS